MEWLDAVIENTSFKAIRAVKGGINTAFESGSEGEWKENNIWMLCLMPCVIL